MKTHALLLAAVPATLLLSLPLHAAAGEPAQAGMSMSMPMPMPPPAPQVVEIAVTSAGFVPAHVTVDAGRPVKLVVTRRTDRTCATEIVMKDFGVDRSLPLDRKVEVTVTPAKPGSYRFTCGMGMVGGVLEAR